jgi:hypothetical protein
LIKLKRGLVQQLMNHMPFIIQQYLQGKLVQSQIAANNNKKKKSQVKTMWFSIDICRHVYKYPRGDW